MLVRMFVQGQPKKQPDQANASRADESPLPPIVGSQKRHCRRRDNRAHIGPRVHKPKSESSLAPGEPFRKSFCCRRKIRRLRNPEQPPHQAKTPGSVGEDVQNRSNAPTEKSQGISNLNSNDIENPPHHQLPKSIRKREG